jgi:hypothetical protein
VPLLGSSCSGLGSRASLPAPDQRELEHAKTIHQDRPQEARGRKRKCYLKSTHHLIASVGQPPRNQKTIKKYMEEGG